MKARRGGSATATQTSGIPGAYWQWAPRAPFCLQRTWTGTAAGCTDSAIQICQSSNPACFQLGGKAPPAAFHSLRALGCSWRGHISRVAADTCCGQQAGGKDPPPAALTAYARWVPSTPHCSWRAQQLHCSLHSALGAGDGKRRREKS